MHVHRSSGSCKLLRRSMKNGRRVSKITLACVTQWEKDEVERLQNLLESQRRHRPGSVLRQEADWALFHFLLAQGVEPWRLQLQTIANQGGF